MIDTAGVEVITGNRSTVRPSLGLQSVVADSEQTLLDTYISAARLVGLVSVNHYVDGSDRPAWVVQTAGSTTKTTVYVRGIDGGLVGSLTAGTTTLQLADISGALIASVVVPSTGNAVAIAGTALFDEYDVAISSTVDTGAAPYGWAAVVQRALALSGLYLTGSRVYNPSTGRFTSRDPVVGGNENSYAYPNDPVNLSDYCGKSSKVDCVKLLNDIQRKSKKLARRAKELDPKSSSYKGHLKAFKELQSSLRADIAKFRSHCGKNLPDVLSTAANAAWQQVAAVAVALLVIVAFIIAVLASGLWGAAFA